MAEEVAKKQEPRMPTRREEGRDPFLALRERMDRVMEDFFGGFDWPSPRWAISPFEWRMGVFTPSLDVRDEGNQIRIEAELPGMSEKDVEISLTGDAITIRGEKKQETEQKEKSYYRMERSYGSFERTVPLPVDVDREKVEARFRNGVLDITLPKTQEAVQATKKIPIKTA
jgi:HSP20 family protein